MNGRIRALLVTLLSVAPVIANAGSPLLLRDSGVPATWANGGRNIAFKTDLGGLGPMTNAEAVAQTMAAFARFEAIPTATATFIHAGSLGIDVGPANVFDTLGDGESSVAVVYDEDGSITQDFFGDSLAVLGFTITEPGEDADIFEALIVLNGAAIGEFGYTVDEMLAVQVHEIGHALGLSHSKVNGDLATFGDYTGPGPNNTFPQPPSIDQAIETMYPFLLVGADQGTLHSDDQRIFSSLYPQSGFAAGSGTIRGRVLGLNGITPLNGVNVIARNVANPFHDAASSLTGELALTFLGDSDPFVGVFTLHGLTPGAQYAIYVDRPLGGGFAVPVRQLLPGPEEFYSGAAESTDPRIDRPDTFTPVVVAAGAVANGIDISFNRVLPGPLTIDNFVTRDGGPQFLRPAVEILLPFPVEFGGRTHESVYVHGFEGQVTFNEPDFDLRYNGRTPSFLIGPPAITALQEPLGIHLGGSLAFDQTAETFNVRYSNMPEWLADDSARGANSFAISLSAKKNNRGNLATISYGAITAPGFLAGISAGLDHTTRMERETDLSAFGQGQIARPDGSAAVYEEFAGDFDLAGRSVSFELPRAFVDAFEPNDLLDTARTVKLPFTTAGEYTDLPADDSDSFRFRANAGDLVMAQVSHAMAAGDFPFSGVMRLFGPAGNLVATNVRNAFALPRFFFTIPAGGEYTLQLLPGGFTPRGRYVLSVNAYRGQVLALNADDVSVEVPLKFRFPFQGSSWQSVWVSSNGSLTFGAPETIRVIGDMQRPGFLAGPPRIAPFFTDLDPSGTFVFPFTGMVVMEEKADAMTVHWLSVPMLFDLLLNTFSVTVNSQGDIKFGYGISGGEDFDSRGIIVGVSAGNNAADPGPSDLSRISGLRASGTQYEQYARYLIYDESQHLNEAINIPAFDHAFGDLQFSP